jgi:DNA-binding NarL/FixJ family response regulator
MSFRILVVDDSPVIRKQLRAVLEHHSNWHVCGEAMTGNEALERTRELHPDVVIMDFSMPGMNGLTAAREILKATPGTPLLLFSVFMSKELVHEAKRAGFSGAVGKERVHELTEGVERLLHHGTYFPQS